MASLFVRSLLPWVLEPLQRLSRRAGAPGACSTALLGAPRTCSTALLGTPAGAPRAYSTALLGTPAGAPRACSTALLGTPAGAPRACSTALLGTAEARPFLSGRSPPLLQPALGLKTKRVLRKRCKDCYLVKRRGRWFVYCKTHPRHKQRQM